MFTLIFDIGKTNKKYFVFDTKFNIVIREEIEFPEIEDEDGFKCDDITSISNWIKNSFKKLSSVYKISKVNFSTYGASFVHLNDTGSIVSPLYNYLKPLDKETEEAFLKNFNSKSDFSLETSSPYLGMLNSGIQLYWLKYKKPQIFKKINTSLHFPQYLHYLLSGNKVSEYTSIGCHTGLWDFNRKDYHNWIYKEQIDKKLAPIVSSDKTFISNGLETGVGLHDSSASLIPYLEISKEKFILLSTGTWSISLNPFNEENLTSNDLENDCLMFMSPSGNNVKASRLFLGRELEYQTDILSKKYNKPKDYFKTVSFDRNFYKSLNKENKCFVLKEFGDKVEPNITLDNFNSFEEAYHQLMNELVERQIIALNLAIGSTKGIKSIYIDGGFANNDLFCKMLSIKLPGYNIYKSNLASGSALGAAIILNKSKYNKDIFLNKAKIELVDPKK